MPEIVIINPMMAVDVVIKSFQRRIKPPYLLKTLPNGIPIKRYVSIFQVHLSIGHSAFKAGPINNVGNEIPWLYLVNHEVPNRPFMSWGILSRADIKPCGEPEPTRAPPPASSALATGKSIVRNGT